LILAGYSQGAELTGDLYQILSKTSPLFTHIAAVVLFGDPNYNRGDSAANVKDHLPFDGVLTTDTYDLLARTFNANPGALFRQNVHTFPDYSGGRVFSFCHANDVICQGNPSRVRQFFAGKVLRADEPHDYVKTREASAAAAKVFALLPQIIVPTPAPSVMVAAGSAISIPTCTSASCALVNVTLTNFSAGTHRIDCYSDDPGAGSLPFASYTTTSTTSSFCVYGFPGSNVWAVVDGTYVSNLLLWSGPGGAPPPVEGV
jgi:hypothetical protein